MPDARITDDLSMNALCRQMFERHSETIKVRKADVAAAKLSRIVDSVLRLSNRKGFHATSMRDIANDTGLSMGGLYAYFDSKETLLSMVLETVISTATAQLILPTALPVKDQLKWLIHRHILMTESMTDWFVFAYLEAKSFPAEQRARAVESERETETIFADVIRKGVTEGLFRTDDPQLDAALLKPLLQDWYVKRGKWRKRGQTPAAYAERVSLMIYANLMV
jgi:AcrR family transcriptional regulator